MNKKQPRKRGLKSYALPVIGLLLGTFLIIGSLTALSNGGFSIPGFGSPIVIGSNGGSLTGGGTTITLGNSSGSGGQNVLLPAHLGVQMSLVADYSDGSNETLYSNGSPTLNVLPVVKLHGKQIQNIKARVLLIVTTPNGQQCIGCSAEFLANITALNQQTKFAKWFYRDITAPFVANGTVAMALLPDLPVTPTEAFTDYCSQFGNGTYTCSSIQTQTTHRVNYAVTASVKIYSPTLSLLMFIPQGSVTSTADFTADGNANTCTSCAATGPATILPGGGVGKSPSSPAGNNPPTPSGPGAIVAGGAGSCLSLLPSLTLCGGGNGGHSGNGGTGGGNAGQGAGVGGSGRGCGSLLPLLCISLLPQVAISFLPNAIPSVDASGSSVTSVSVYDQFNHLIENRQDILNFGQDGQTIMNIAPSYLASNMPTWAYPFPVGGFILVMSFIVIFIIAGLWITGIGYLVYIGAIKKT